MNLGCQCLLFVFAYLSILPFSFPYPSLSMPHLSINLFFSVYYVNESTFKMKQYSVSSFYALFLRIALLTSPIITPDNMSIFPSRQNIIIHCSGIFFCGMRLIKLKGIKQKRMTNNLKRRLRLQRALGLQALGRG